MHDEFGADAGADAARAPPAPGRVGGEDRGGQAAHRRGEHARRGRGGGGGVPAPPAEAQPDRGRSRGGSGDGAGARARQRALRASPRAPGAVGDQGRTVAAPALLHAGALRLLQRDDGGHGRERHVGGGRTRQHRGGAGGLLVAGPRGRAPGALGVRRGAVRGRRRRARQRRARQPPQQDGVGQDPG